MNSRIVRLLPLSLMLLLPFAAHSATLFVSHDGSGTDGLSWETAFPTVHAAMLTASSGDHVWVRSATYAGDIRMATGVSMFGGFAGTEGSNEFHLRDWKINPTVLSGGTPVVKAADETVIDGFVVRDGIAEAPGGGGILVLSVRADIKNCAIINNRKRDNVFAHGAGVYCKDATGTIENCIVRSNRITVPAGGKGSGIAIENSSAIITSCTLSQNLVNADGGGLSVLDSYLRIENSRIVENRAESGSSFARGGGIFTSSSRLVLDRCVIARNVAKGAIVPFGGGSDGGAIYSLANVDATLTNCLVEGNIALRGAAMTVGTRSVFVLDSCTLVGQRRERDPDYLIDINGGGTPYVINSVLYSNDIRSVFPTGLSYSPTSYSDIEGGYPGEGNIDADPMFVDPENGNFRLMQGSPCIDSGTDTGLTHDLDGNPRPIGRYDMGAYEFPFLRSDINGDGVVDALDLLIFSEDWKKVSGP